MSIFFNAEIRFLVSHASCIMVYFCKPRYIVSIKLLLRRTLVRLDILLSFYLSLPTNRALRHVAKQLKTFFIDFQLVSTELYRSVEITGTINKFINNFIGVFLYWLQKVAIPAKAKVCDARNDQQNYKCPAQKK